MDECIFCKIVKGEIPCFKVFENDKVLAFGDINPITRGHSLIIPKRHAENLWQIPEEDLMAVHMASKKIIEGMKKALSPAGVACVQLNGRGVNQVVMHYHLHLIPRSGQEPPLPVSEWDLKEGNMEEIQKTVAKISQAISD